MDFGALLHVAKKNSETAKSNESKFYNTKFSAPKKEIKEKKLSDNIKKFLAKKEQEEKEEARLKKEKLAKLLALRDEKSKNKIRKMLKVTKSANKSVLEDAVDNENTAITLQGPDQPDEDDYGYVSQEAAAFYQKYMDKVKAIPEENKFAPSKYISKTDLSGTKDRVKEAIRREQEEKNYTNRMKSKSLDASELGKSNEDSSHLQYGKKKDLYDPIAEQELDKECQKRMEEERKKIKLKKLPPPPMDFKELLKLAEKKQHEPVEIEVEIKKEPERLLTKKEKKELEERKAYLEERERRKRETANQHKTQLNGKTSKKNGISSTSVSIPNDSRKSLTNDKISKSNTIQNKPGFVPPPAKDAFKKPTNSMISKPKTYDLKTKNVELLKTKIDSSVNGSVSRNSSSITNSNPNQSLKVTPSKPNNTINVSSASTSYYPSKIKSSVSNSSSNQMFQKKSVNNHKAIQENYETKSKSLPPTMNQERARYLPLTDTRSSKCFKKPIKRRIIDDEDEYDSELDDFIDDGPEEESENYSSYIKEIFGYDKSRYRDVDEDDQNMESSFVQQMKEEQISKKIGLMEDLEDMRLEAEEKKKKASVKKRKVN